MNNAVKDGGEKLQGFAKVSGMSGQEFAETWKKDPYAAVQAFEKGLAGQNKEGKNVKAMLKDLGITELRETDTVLRLANGNKQLQTARENANKGYKEGNALSKEAETKYKTLGNQMKIFMNHVRALGIEIGSALAPVLIGMMKVLTPVIDALAKAPAPIKLMVVALGLIPVVAVPVLASLAAITGAMGLMGQAMSTATVAAGSNGRALKIYAATMGMLTNPIGTLKNALDVIPGKMARTSKATNVLKGNTIAAGTGLGSMITPMGRLSTQAGKTGTTVGMAGTAMATSGKKASFASRLFSFFGSKLKFLAPLGSLLTSAFTALVAVLGAVSAPIWIAIGAVVAIGGAFVIAYKKVKWFRDGVNGLWYTMKVFGGGILGAVFKPLKALGGLFAWLGGTAIKKATKGIQGWYSSLDKDDLLVKSAGALQKFGNGFKNVMKTLGSATHKASDTTKVLGKGVSKETKSALGNYVKYSNQSSKIMEQVKLNHGKISKEKARQLLSIEDKLSKDIISQLEKRKQSQLKNARDVLKDSKVLSQQEKDEILQNITDKNDKVIQKEKELNAKIKQARIAAQADGVITAKEKANIDKLEKQRRELVTENLTKTEKEQGKILSRMQHNRKAMSVSEASDAIKDAEKARKARVKEVNDEYNDKVYAIDQMVGLSKERKKKLLDEAADERDKEIKEANKKKKGVVKTVKSQNKDIDNEMDLSNGKVYTKAQQWWNNFSDGFSKSMAKAWSKMSKNASNFGSLLVDGIMNIGTWIASVKAKADTFWNNFGTALMSNLSSVGGWIKTQSAQFGTVFINGIMNTGSWIVSVKAKANAFWSAFGSAIMSGLSTIGSWFTNVGSTLWGWIKTGWSFAVTNGFTLWNTLKTVALTAWTGVSGWFVSMGGKLWSAIKQGWNTWITTQGNLWTSLITALGTAWAAIRVWFVTKGQQMGSALSQGWTAMKGFVVGTFNSIWTSVKVVWQGIWGTITYWTGAIWNRVKSVWSWIKNNTILAFTSVWNFIKRIWAGIKNTIVYWTGAIWNRIKSVWSWIKTNTLGAFTYVWNTVKRIWAGIKGTIVYWTSAIWNRVKSVWNWIKSNTLNAFNYVWNTIKRIWKGIKGTITYWTGVIWGRIKAIWTNIKNFTSNIFNSVWGTVKRIWTNIKNAVIGRAKALWSGVRNTWNNLKKGTTGIFNSVGGFMSSKWNSIKSGTVNKAKALWSGVRGAWGSLSKGTRNTMNAVGGFMSKKWQGIKNGTVNLVTGMKNKVTGVMNKMGDAIKSVTGKIKGFFSGMIDKVKGGLNKLIEGVNWVGGKLGMDKLPKIKLHTGTEHTNTTTNVVKNGKIARDTFATVGDKGRGNGPGGFRHEAIKYPNGKMAITPNRDTTAFLPKGSSVMNGMQTHSMLSGLPKFSNGSLSNKKPKKKKKGDNVFGDAWDSTKAGAAKVVDGGKAVVSKSLEAAAKGKEWMSKTIGDVMDWIEKPGKLLNKVLEGVGLDLDGFGIKKAAELPYDMMKGMFSKLKKAAIDTFTSWMEEQGGDGDGGYIDLSKGINFGFARTAAEAARMGYPFPRAHHGLDINYGYGSKLYSTLSGTATAKSGYNGGFGNSMWIKSGALQAIYGHMSKLAFSGSKKVKPGTYLGLSGGDPARQGASAGDSTGPHLHYEMRKNGVPFDPRNWLKKNNGGGSKNKKASAWKDDIKRAAKQMKVSLKGNDLNNIISLIHAESGGNAGVTQGNIGDINNRLGTPAQGLLQYVPSTFKNYAVKGHKNIKNGYDQLLAFFNNKYWRSQFNPNGGWSPSGPRRFAHGGMIKKHGLYEAGEGNRPEMVLPLTNKVRAIQLIDQAKSFMGVDDSGDISTTSNDNNGSMDIIAQLMEQNNRLLEALINTVDNKELTVDKQAIIDTANTGMARKYKDRSYIRGGR